MYDVKSRKRPNHRLILHTQKQECAICKSWLSSAIFDRAQVTMLSCPVHLISTLCMLP